LKVRRSITSYCLSPREGQFETSRHPTRQKQFLSMSVSKKPASSSVPPVEPTTAEDPFQHLLLELSWAAAEGGDFAALVQFFCAETRKFLKVSGAYYWRLEENEGLVAVGADGHLAERFRAARLQLSEAAVATD